MGCAKRNEVIKSEKYKTDIQHPLNCRETCLFYTSDIKNQRYFLYELDWAQLSFYDRLHKPGAFLK